MAQIRKRREAAEDKRQFVLDYLTKYGSIEVIDSQFHDRFFDKFGGRAQEKSDGSRVVYRAQRLLEEMVKDGTITRYRQSNEVQAVGLPPWMWIYKLKTTN